MDTASNKSGISRRNIFGASLGWITALGSAAMLDNASAQERRSKPFVDQSPIQRPSAHFRRWRGRLRTRRGRHGSGEAPTTNPPTS
jgi:hypothetical protein